ncbi:C69 family dipeptidase [uncultured Parasutterella sp.]|uniref:C69 family dipeptidase n=1 Tax=uncultured Parasutterella sp. TaxID=1263098 RepID=UPI002591B4DD|nr:C69 family dipeptidase [uncultured Parasutterella sp.]
MTKFALTAAALAAGLILGTNAIACSTVVVGKNASATGNILVGHNEDNDSRIITSQYWVPAADHPAGEVIEYEPDAAKIPQVPHTYGYYWSQTLHPAGYSYSDGFVNENGVSLASNQSYDTYDKDEAVKDGGVGYAIRRIVAERATNARDGVNIAIDLVKKYGYRAAGRVYTIADKDEAWQLNLIRGGRYLAKKIGDNEVLYIANAYTLGPVDVNAPDVIASPDLIEHAIKMGTYKPKKEGDYSDFNFREAYQTDARRDADWIKDRSQTGWKYLTGKEIQNPNDFPYSITPSKKLTVEDVKNILRSHYAHEKRDNGFFHQSINDICNPGTFESVVYEMVPNKNYTIGWRTSGMPSENPYIPFYPLAKPSAAQSFMTPDEATRQQFHAKASSFDYKPELPLYTFLTNQALSDYLDGHKKLAKMISAQEKDWDKGRKSVEQQAALAEKVGGTEKALNVLHAFNVNAYQQGANLVAKAKDALPKTNVLFLEESISQGNDKAAKVAILGSKTFDASKIDAKSVRIQPAHPTEDVEIIPDPATAQSVAMKDVNGDGIPDAVITFSGKQAAKYCVPEVTQDVYVYAKANGKKIAGFDTIKVIK